MSSKLYLGNVAQVVDSTMTVLTGKKLEIIDAPSTSTSVANKSYIDSEVKKVQDALNLVTAGSDVNFDTLLEIKNLADSIASTGASNLTAQISSEASARQAADTTLTSAIAAEETARQSADATLTSAITTEVTDRQTAVTNEANARIAKDDELKMLSVNYSKKMLYYLIYNKPAMAASNFTNPIYPAPLELCDYGVLTNPANFDGWRMKNTVPGTKFHMYVPAGGLKVGDVKAMYLELCAVSVVSMPFFTIYTTPKNNAGDAFPGFYRSKITYIRNSSDTLVGNTNYNMVANLKNVTVFNSNYFTQHNTILDTFSSDGIGSISKANIGTATNVLEQVFNIYDTDDILAFAIGSDSSASVGNVECIIGKFKVQLESGVCEFVFNNSEVFDNYMKERNSQLWNRLYGTSATDDPYMNTSYNIPVPDYTIR
jgi:hypothetical protein